MKRLVLTAAVLAGFVASTPAGACAAGPGNPCFHDPYVATVTGDVWIDADADGARDGDEVVAGGLVWADYDHDGARQEGEPEVEVEPDGRYALPVDTRRGDRADVRVRFPRSPAAGDPYAPDCLAPSADCVRTLAVAAGQRIDDVRFPVVTVAEIHGMIWDDRDDDGKRQENEGGVERMRVFIDDNGNGKREPSEPASHQTLSDGLYRFPVPTRYQAAGGALPPLRLDQVAGTDCSGPDDCAVNGLRTRSAQVTTASHGVARPVVIFVHGYGGARIGCPTKDIWFALPYPALDDMRLGRDGLGLRRADGGSECSERAGVTGLLREVAGGDIYGGASEHFDAITWPGRHFDYVWDWRRSPAAAVAGLDALVEKARRELGVARVQLVGHSMGGLVIREYLADGARAEKVQRVATVGTPYWGSPKTIFPLSAGVEVPFISAMDAFLNNAWLKAATRTFPGHFALVPSIASYGPWLKVKGVDGGRALDVAGVAEYLQRIGMTPELFLRGQAEHAATLDHYDDHGVDYEVIVGAGMPTIGSVSIEHQAPLDKFEVSWVSGDETVPAVSGAHDTPAEHLHYVCGVSHVPLTVAPATKELLDPFIIRAEPMRGAGAPCPFAASELDVYYPDTLSTLAKAAQAGGPRVIARGKSLSLRDAERAGLVQVIAVGPSTKIVARDGSDVRVELPAGGTATVRSLTEKGAGPERRFAGAMAVALGGSGAVTRNGKPLKPAAKDTTPPRTTASYRGGKLVLKARGAAATYVTVAGKTRRYTKPLKLTRKQLAKTTYASVDKWGNAETPRRARSAVTRIE